MKKPILSVVAAAIAASTIFATPAANADDRRGMRHYAVTITNITRGQILTPPVVIAHNEGYKLFMLGSAASPELAMLAEDGAATALLNAAAGMPSVYQTAMGSGVIMPGASMTVEIDTSNKFSEITVAAMLASTNDGFMAARGVEAPLRGDVTVEAGAYDAGSEANSENCAFIPGPPCGHPGVRDTAGAEGYVHVHAGIHGGGGLNPAMHDWRSAVAQIQIKRMD